MGHAGSAGALPDGGGGGGLGCPLQHLEVRTVTHASSVVVTNLPEVPGARETTYTLDFGPIVLGEQRVRAVILRNLTDTYVDVQSSAPDHEVGTSQLGTRSLSFR